MDSPTPTVSPLRQRMIDDMRMRKMAPKTQSAYIRHVGRLAAYLKRSPDTATIEDLRRFQLHLVDQGTSPITLNATITGLKFFFDITVRRPDMTIGMQAVQLPQKLPVVLSRDEVARLIAAGPSLKYQTALALAYGAGLRVSEVVALKVGDIDSQRMTLCALSRPRAARIATPCSRRCCCSDCVLGGALPMHRARCGPAAGCSRAWTQSIR